MDARRCSRDRGCSEDTRAGERGERARRAGWVRRVSAPVSVSLSSRQAVTFTGKYARSHQLPSMFRGSNKEGTPSRPITAAPPTARGTTERPARRDRRARSSARRRPSRIASRTTARAPCLSVRPRASTSRPSAPCCAASWTTTPRMPWFPLAREPSRAARAPCERTGASVASPR